MNYLPTGNIKQQSAFGCRMTNVLAPPVVSACPVKSVVLLLCIYNCLNSGRRCWAFVPSFGSLFCVRDKFRRCRSLCCVNKRVRGRFKPVPGLVRFEVASLVITHACREWDRLHNALFHTSRASSLGVQLMGRQVIFWVSHRRWQIIANLFQLNVAENLDFILQPFHRQFHVA